MKFSCHGNAKSCTSGYGFIWHLLNAWLNLKLMHDSELITFKTSLVYNKHGTENTIMDKALRSFAHLPMMTSVASFLPEKSKS